MSPTSAGINMQDVSFWIRNGKKTAGGRDTEGKDLCEGAKIVKDHKGVEHLFIPHCYSKRINQHSRSLLQALRANADVKLLIYRSDPDLPDVGDIESV